MRYNPFTKRAQPSITRAVLHENGWIGSREGYLIQIYRQRPPAPAIEFKVCVNFRWQRYPAASVAEALERLNGILRTLPAKRAKQAA